MISNRQTIQHFWQTHAFSLMLWAAMLVYLCIYVCVASPSTVTLDYYTAAQNWLHSQPLYDGSGWTFIYFPQAAVLYLAVGWLPFTVSEIIWRIILVLILVISYSQFCSITAFSNRRFFFCLTAATFFIASGALKLGQMNVMLVALLLLTLSAIYYKKLTLAAGLLVLNIALKPTAIVFLLIFMVLYPRLILRIIIFVILAFLLPFCLQHAHYVWQQYHACYANFHHLIAQTTATGWAQIYGLLQELFTWVFPDKIVYYLRYLFAAITLGIAYYSRKKCVPKNALLLIYAFAAAYLMLFNPRTENNDYVIILPAMIYFIFYFYRSHRWIAWSFIFYVILMAINYNFSTLLQIPSNIFRPLAAVLFVAQLIYQLWRPQGSLQRAIADGRHKQQ